MKIIPANIGIVGYGVVGETLAYGFEKKGDRIKFYDKFKHSDSLKAVVEGSDFIFVCLPTPFDAEKMKIDLSIMDENIHAIDKYSCGTEKIIIIKSTVIPGTTRRYAGIYPGTRFCFNPEFLTEAHSKEDFLSQDRIVIGADSQRVSWAMIDLYRQRFPGVAIFPTDPTSAEVVKYMGNAFLAMKVAFGNQFFDLCNKLGLSYGEVAKIVAADKRIGPSHLAVTSQRGFGGKCFPKDLAAIIGVFNDLKIDPVLLKTLWDYNLNVRKVKDWEDIPFVQTTPDKRE